MVLITTGHTGRTILRAETLKNRKLVFKQLRKIGFDRHRARVYAKLETIKGGKVYVGNPPIEEAQCPTP